MSHTFQVAKSTTRQIKWTDKKTNKPKTADIIEIAGTLKFDGGILYTTMRHYKELQPGTYSVEYEYKNNDFGQITITPRIMD